MREYARQTRHPPADHPGAAPHRPAVEPLARARDARVRPRRPQADRQPSPRDRRPRHASALPGLPDQAPRLPGGDRARTRERGPRVRGDALVRRRLLRGPRAGALWRRPSRQASGRLPLDPTCRPRRRRRFVRSAGSAARRAGTSANRLWRLRGFVDLLAGGVGVRRGRRDPETPTVGSALDFWRVEAYRAWTGCSGSAPR